MPEYHVVGLAHEGSRTYMYGAMTRLEMEQAMRQAAMEGRTIERWVAQTPRGEMLLGGPSIDADMLRPIRTIICPVCEAEGCAICRFSGITTERELQKYQPWQLVPRSKRPG